MRPLWKPVVAGCLALALFACDRGPDALHVLAEAAFETEDAGSLRYTVMRTDPPTDEREEELTMVGRGVLDLRRERSLRVWEPEGGQFPGEESVCPEEANRLLVTQGSWYLLSPVWSSCEPFWFELDMPTLRTQGAGGLRPIDVLGFGSVPPVEPLEVLAYLRLTPGEVTEVGQEEVRGDTTTRYRFEPSDPPGAPSDVWVDGRGHVRRVHHEGDSVTTLELFEIGSAPPVPVQPDGQVEPGDWIVRLHLEDTGAPE